MENNEIISLIENTTELLDPANRNITIHDDRRVKSYLVYLGELRDFYGITSDKDEKK